MAGATRYDTRSEAETMIETQQHFPELALVLEDLLGISGSSLSGSEQGEIRLLAYPALAPEEAEMVFRDLRSLATGGNDFPCGIVIYWPSGSAPWEESDGLGPRERRAFELVVGLARDVEQARRLLRSDVQPAPGWAITQVLAVLEAKNLYSKLRGFSHAGGFDLTNQVLGSARLILRQLREAADSSTGEGLPQTLSASRNWYLAAASPGSLLEAQSIEWDRFLEDASEIWDKFLEFVALDGEAAIDSASPRPAPIWALSEEIVRHARDLPEDVRDWTEHNIGIIESLLAGLTECRSKAGLRTPIPSAEVGISDTGPFAASSPTEAIGGAGPPSETLRILVVDDHAVAWKPVLRVVHAQLVRRFGPAVRMEFSTDGKYVTTNDGLTPLLGAIAEYDVVLLDIFMGDVFGLSLLSEIRVAFLHLPIVLWTTSRDIDLPSGANLANGFLFKKTTTIDDIVGTIGRWLEHGRSARIVTLPNRFFDHTIRRVEHRKAISSLMKWALQLVDGFPALSDSYFRGFTDHGGRHFVQLLQHSEHLIRPLLLAGRLFSLNLEQREEELAAFYLGLICHEFGMFPVFATEEGKVKKLNTDESNVVRMLHSVRGMEFLASDKHWSGEFREVAASIKNTNGFLSTAVPLIVGYHSRLLSLEDFGHVRGETETARKIKNRADMGKEIERIYVPSVESVQQTLVELTRRDVFPERREVMRGLCGLFRFVDAIDIGRSRLPATFLRNSRMPSRRQRDGPQKWERKYKQYTKDLREYLKQELVAEVRVDHGRVSFDLTVPRPTVETCEEIRHLLPEASLDSIVEPWGLGGRQFVGDQSTVERMNKLLITNIAELRLKRSSRLREISLTGVRGTASMGARVLATVAVLAVAGQVLEEYRAIKVCGLDRHIQLGEFSWGREEGWLSNVPVLKSIYGNTLVQDSV